MLESPNREEVAARDEHAFDTWPSFIERTQPRGEQRGPAAQGSLCWSLLAGQEALQAGVDGPLGEVVVQQGVALLVQVGATRLRALLVPEHDRHVGIVGHRVLNGANEVVGLLLGGDPALPVRRVRAIRVVRPAELREPPAVPVVRVLRGSVGDALVRVGRDDVERVPAAEGVDLADPAVVVGGGSAEDDLRCGVAGLEAGVGGAEERDVLLHGSLPEGLARVGLVPDLPGGDAAVPVARGPAGEVGVVLGIRRRHLVRLAPVRPGGGQPEGDEDVEAARPGLVDAVVDHADVPGVARALDAVLDPVPGDVDANPANAGSRQLVEHGQTGGIGVEGPRAVELRADPGHRTGGRWRWRWWRWWRWRRRRRRRRRWRWRRRWRRRRWRWRRWGRRRWGRRRWWGGRGGRRRRAAVAA